MDIVEEDLKEHVEEEGARVTEKLTSVIDEVELKQDEHTPRHSTVKPPSIIRNTKMDHRETAEGDESADTMSRRTTIADKVVEVLPDDLDESGKRVDLSIATIKEIKTRKKEARRLKKLLQKERDDRLMEEAEEHEREYREMRDLNRQERMSERLTRRTESSILYEEYDQLLLKEVEEEMSSSSESSVSEKSVKQLSFSLAHTVFAALEDMPSLSDLSLSLDDESQLDNRSQSIMTTKSDDTGRFVDPLTGGSLRSSSDSYYESYASGEYDEECTAEDDSPNIQLSLDDLVDDEKPEPRKSSIRSEDYEHEATLINFKSQAILRDYSLQSAEEDPNAVKASSQIVSDFLFNLINIAVNQIHDATSKLNLSRHLDIRKLYDELEQVVEQQMVEKYRNSVLNNKVFDYYKRNNLDRLIEDRTFLSEIIDRRRYHDALVRVDLLRERAKQTKSKYATLMCSVLMDLCNCQTVSMHLDDHLNNLIEKTIITKDSELLKKVVEREMRLLNNKRNEISDWRLHLIMKNHTLARYDEKLSRIAAINEDVNMDTFLLVQNQCNTLQKKLEEKNASLDSMHSQYYNELHLLAHIRERSTELSEQLQMVHAEYQAKYNYQLKLRDKLFHLKLERDNMRKQLRNLTFQGGLLQYHGLMIDFDNTVERVAKLQANVQTQRLNMQQLELKVEALTTPKDRQ